MATASVSCSFLAPLSSSILRRHTAFSASYNASPRWRRRRHLLPLAQGPDLLGDFGARDPFPEEVESNFCENVLGNTDTLHRILIPNISALSLAKISCEHISPSQPPISAEDAERLLRKVVGWRLVDGEGGMRIQCLWKVRDYRCGVELITRIYHVAEAAGHCFPNLHLEQPNQVRAELWTASIGGLTTNDFILAAKIDLIETSDLLPKKRIWA
ncbi:probable pterin-4-alpha-carbinolamine dehydratase, chloroplastic [Zingiber officinale]|uniref:probable pterin-4-alpha-carbinolamine dehydratase, chloroplastic n=1 Tax=Zingiber officinale TaxID=94328 RepID=UPI001C4D985B|nr:probable pterin-4-alpha-carbinolamine dehydratase, chloroplastic [Zingiber officinale]